jgi:hypothetical protein
MKALVPYIHLYLTAKVNVDVTQTLRSLEYLIKNIII